MRRIQTTIICGDFGKFWNCMWAYRKDCPQSMQDACREASTEKRSEDTCPSCGEAELVPHSGAGRGQYRDYPDLLVCPVCWHKYVKRDGKLVRIKKVKP